MKIFYLITGLLLTQFSISFAQIQTFYVKPIQTDINYSSLEDSNYVVRNTSTNVNKLVLFLGGSFSSPDDYSLFCQYPATLGFDVISLKYLNDIAAFPSGTSADSLSFNKYRQELCFGTPVSPLVVVDTLNSIYTRTLKLVQYLALTYPLQNWGQYLATPTTLDWSKIVVSGHSQGSGHACYLGKYFPVERVIMFSGPNDYSTFYNRPANWLRQSGTTPTIKHFSFLHIQDEIVPFDFQFNNINALGMLQSDDTTLVDGLSNPFLNSHCLYTNIPAFSFHSSTIGGNPTLPSVWNYMLTSLLSTGVKDLTSNYEIIKIYPNPVMTELNFSISVNDINEVLISNLQGQVLINIKNKNRIDISNLTNGIYIVTIKQGQNMHSKKFIKE